MRGKRNPQAGCYSGTTKSSHCRNAGNTPRRVPTLPSTRGRFGSRWSRGIGILRSRVSYKDFSHPSDIFADQIDTQELLSIFEPSFVLRFDRFGFGEKAD